MKTLLFKAADRGTADYGWLKPNYYFSFAQYHNAAKTQFGLLRVLNDPFTGALQHKDSSGGEGVIKAGDVQIMSAGTGVQHSEANESATDPVTLFQVWIFPKERNITPRYGQKNFDVTERANKWQTVVSPLDADNALWINQDAKFSLTNLDAGKEVIYSNAFKNNGVFLVVINGSVTVNGEQLNKRDALGISETESFSIVASEDAELLAIEIPMN